MKSIKYENITVEDIENIIKTGYITEIFFDGDNKTVNIKEAEYIEIEKAFKQLADSFQPVIEAICEIGKIMYNAFNTIFKDLKYLLNKKITKKKFIKLLQSEGIQRNKINEIIKNNKRPYTYARYYETLKKFSNDEGK